MNEYPLVNVLISTYNGEKYIEEQLNSILNQTYPHIEIYVRDDGSTDGTRRILEQYGGRENVHCEYKNNVGISASFYELLSMPAGGDYWAFSDQDDIWLPNKIEQAVNWMLKQKDGACIPLLYHSGFTMFGEGIEERPYAPKVKCFDFRMSITASVVYAFSIMINAKLREMYLQCDPLLVRAHDNTNAMIALAFGRLYMDPAILARHRVHNGNASSHDLKSKLALFKTFLHTQNDYTTRAKEFERVFGAKLGPRDSRMLGWFTKDRFGIGLRLKKAFYYKRWVTSLYSEAGMRLLMLAGKV